MKSKPVLMGLILIFAFAHEVKAHCQIPCGIYGDAARFAAMMEDVETLKKSVAMIDAEARAESPDYNQLVRWVINKETHADRIKGVALDYFLAQRIKEGQENYGQKLAALHRIIVLSMKAKQTTEAKVVDDLEAAIRAFEELYTAGEQK